MASPRAAPSPVFKSVFPKGECTTHAEEHGYQKPQGEAGEAGHRCCQNLIQPTSTDPYGKAVGTTDSPGCINDC